MCRAFFSEIVPQWISMEFLSSDTFWPIRWEDLSGGKGQCWPIANALSLIYGDFSALSDLSFAIMFWKWKWKEVFSHLRRNHDLFKLKTKYQPYRPLPITFAHHWCLPYSLCLLCPHKRLEICHILCPLLPDISIISVQRRGGEERGWVAWRHLACLSAVPVLSQA